MKSRWRRLVEAWPTPTENEVVIPASQLPMHLRPTFGLETEIISLIDDFDGLLRRTWVGTKRPHIPGYVESSLFDRLDHALRVGLFDSGELDRWRAALKTRCDILVPDRPMPSRSEIVDGIDTLKELLSKGEERLRRLEIIHGTEGAQVAYLPPRSDT